MKSIIIVLIGASLILSAMSCDAIGQKSKVVGKWQCVKITKIDGREENLANFSHSIKIIEFFSDNTYKMGGISGKWIILEDGRIKKQDVFGNMDIGTIQDDKIIFDKVGGIYKVFYKKM